MIRLLAVAACYPAAFASAEPTAEPTTKDVSRDGGRNVVENLRGPRSPPTFREGLTPLPL